MYKFLATGEPLLCQPMSPIYKEMLAIDGITTTLEGWILDLQPKLPHMQNNVSKFSFASYKISTLKHYDTILLDTAMKARFFTDEELAQIASLEEEVKITFYQRKKYNKMSEEEIILYEANMKKLRQRLAAMGGEAAFVYHTAMEDGESEEGALEIIESMLTPGHFRKMVGILTGARVASLAATFSRKFKELDNDAQASYNAFSSKVTSRIIPLLDKDEKKKYKFLMKQYDNELKNLLSKMESCQTRRSSYGKGAKKYKTNASGRKMVGNDGKGSGANMDPRMKAAVKAKLADPSLNYYQALVNGGFDFQSPELNKTGLCIGEPKGALKVKDTDGRTYQKRKDSLKEHLKHTAKRQKAKEEGLSYTKKGGIQDAKAANQPTTSATMSGVVTSKSTASSKTTESGNKRKASDFFKVDKTEEKKTKSTRSKSSTIKREDNPKKMAAPAKKKDTSKKTAPKMKTTRSKSSVGTSQK